MVIRVAFVRSFGGDLGDGGAGGGLVDDVTDLTSGALQAEPAVHR